MSEATAGWWLDGIGIGAAIVWLIGAVFVSRSAAMLGSGVTGESTADRDPADFVRRARETLTQGIANSPLARIQLQQATESTLTWEGRGGGLRHVASLRATGSQGRTRAVWQVEASSSLITAARWVSALGALVTAGLYWLLSEFVATSENAALRGQVFQMMQCIHTLWPPFLLSGLARGMKRRLVADLERTLSNLGFGNAT
jgi:hypothetical protein